MVLFVFWLGLILLIPIFITTYFYYDNCANKLFFSLYLFGVVRVVSGYLTKRNKGGFYLHIKNKAIIIDAQLFKSFRGGDSGAVKAFSIRKAYLILDVGVKNLSTIFIANSFFTVLSSVYSLIKSTSSGVELEKTLNIYCDNTEFKAFKLKLVVFFNFLSICFMIIANYKNRLGKVYE